MQYKELKERFEKACEEATLKHGVDKKHRLRLAFNVNDLVFTKKNKAVCYANEAKSDIKYRIEHLVYNKSDYGPCYKIITDWELLLKVSDDN
jgi:hypothetical protein